MGIFSKIMAMASSAEHTYTVDSEQEAWLGILYTIIAADGEIKDVEINELCDRLQSKTFFKEVDVTDLYHLANQAYQKHGGKALIDKCSAKISDSNKPTVLTLAIELMVADGHEDDEEKKLIDYLADKLGIQSKTSDQIAEVLNWRNKYNKFS